MVVFYLALCAVFPGLFGLGAVVVRRLPGWPIWFAVLWAAQEWLKSIFPFGGHKGSSIAFMIEILAGALTGGPFGFEDRSHEYPGAETPKAGQTVILIDPLHVPDFYVKYRVSDLDLFTHGILRDIVRNSLNEVASTYNVEDIYGDHKAEFIHKVQALIEQRVAPVGVGVQQFGFIGAPRVPAVIATAITAKAQAIQQAERARNELATTQAEAAKKIAEAEGDAKSLVTRAQGEADANRIRQNSLTPQLLELRRIENNKEMINKWNGQLPTVQSGSGGALMLQLPRPQ